jgi:hypothetical protein
VGVVNVVVNVVVKERTEEGGKEGRKEGRKELGRWGNSRSGSRRQQTVCDGAQGVAMLSIHGQIHVIPGHWQSKGLIWSAVRVLVRVVVLWCLAGMQDTTRRAVPTYLVLGRGEVGGTASRSQSPGSSLSPSPSPSPCQQTGHAACRVKTRAKRRLHRLRCHCHDDNQVARWPGLSCAGSR